MEDKGELADARHIYRQLPEISHLRFKLLFCFVSLTILCISAVAQENTTDYWMDKAEEYAYNSSFEEVLSALDEVLKIDSGNETALILKASYLGIVGKTNESSETYEKALALLEDDLKDPNNAEAWQKKAEILRSLKRQNESIAAYEKTLEAFNRRIEKDPKDADAWIGKGNALRYLGKWDEARDAYNEAIEIDPQDYRAWGRKAEVIGRIGDINESMEAYDKTIELIPSNNTRELADYWMSKAEVLGFAGSRWNEALTALNHSLELDPSSRVNWRFKAEILSSELGRKDEAVEAFDESLKLNPDDAEGWQWKASLLTEMKRYNESLEAYDKAIELTPENDTKDLALNWFSKGWALNKTGRQEEARAALQKSLEYYDQAILKNAGDISLLQQKGMALFELGRYDDAIEVYDQVLTDSHDIEFSATKTSARIGKGDALRALGKNEEAISAYNKAIELGPLYSNAWHGKGEAQKAMGQVVNASMSFLVADKLGYEE